MATYTVTSRAKLIYVGDAGWSIHWVAKNATALLCNPEGNSVGNLQNSTASGKGWKYGLQLTTTEAVFGEGFGTWQEAALAAAERYEAGELAGPVGERVGEGE